MPRIHSICLSDKAHAAGGADAAPRVVVCGASGAGKSTIAAAARRAISTRELFGPSAPGPGPSSAKSRYATTHPRNREPKIDHSAMVSESGIEVIELNEHSSAGAIDDALEKAAIVLVVADATQPGSWSDTAAAWSDRLRLSQHLTSSGSSNTGSVGGGHHAACTLLIINKIDAAPPSIDDERRSRTLMQVHGFSGSYFTSTNHSAQLDAMLKPVADHVVSREEKRAELAGRHQDHHHHGRISACAKA